MTSYDTAGLLDRVVAFIERYVELRSSAQYDVLALWVAHLCNRRRLHDALSGRPIARKAIREDSPS
jgi:hypothetical protein